MFTPEENSSNYASILTATQTLTFLDYVEFLYGCDDFQNSKYVYYLHFHQTDINTTE